MNFIEFMQDPEKNCRKATGEYRESQGDEPGWYQEVRDKFKVFRNSTRVDEGSVEHARYFIEVDLGIPLAPPTPQRPGVGVMMTDSEYGKYIITAYTEKKLDVYILDADGSSRLIAIEGILDDRPATEEEITAFFHPEVDVEARTEEILDYFGQKEKITTVPVGLVPGSEEE